MLRPDHLTLCMGLPRPHRRHHVAGAACKEPRILRFRTEHIPGISGTSRRHGHPFAVQSYQPDGGTTTGWIEGNRSCTGHSGAGSQCRIKVKSPGPYCPGHCRYLSVYRWLSMLEEAQLILPVFTRLHAFNIHPLAVANVYLVFGENRPQYPRIRHITLLRFAIHLHNVLNFP